MEERKSVAPSPRPGLQEAFLAQTYSMVPFFLLETETLSLWPHVASGEV